MLLMVPPWWPMHKLKTPDSEQRHTRELQTKADLSILSSCLSAVKCVCQSKSGKKLHQSLTTSRSKQFKDLIALFTCLMMHTKLYSYMQLNMFSVNNHSENKCHIYITINTNILLNPFLMHFTHVLFHGSLIYMYRVITCILPRKFTLSVKELKSCSLMQKRT